jgi:hypothetical protein
MLINYAYQIDFIKTNYENCILEDSKYITKENRINIYEKYGKKAYEKNVRSNKIKDLLNDEYLNKISFYTPENPTNYKYDFDGSNIKNNICYALSFLKSAFIKNVLNNQYREKLNYTLYIDDVIFFYPSQFINDQIIDYPKSTIQIDEDQYSLAKENKSLQIKLQNSVLNKDSLLEDSNSEEKEKYSSVGNEPTSTQGNSLFQNSGYLGAVGNILYTVWDTGVQATSGVREKMSEYTIGKGILYIGGKVIEGVAYIGGKIIEKGSDIINSEMTKSIVHKAGEGFSYITSKITRRNNNENNENSNYIDINDDINNSRDKTYIKNSNSDDENNYNILYDKSENLL